MSVLAIFIDPMNPNNWRPEERPSMERHFGPIVEIGPDINWLDAVNKYKPDTLFWRLDGEKTPRWFWEQAMLVSTLLTDNKFYRQINNPHGWINVHCKDEAFRQWTDHGFSCPDWFSFDTREDFYRKRNGMKTSFLLRINDGNTGEGSYLVNTEDELEKALDESFAVDLTAKYGPGVNRTRVVSKFYDHVKYGYRYSIRVVVCGDKVIVGYARLSNPDDWVAIEEKFTESMAPAWIKLQKEAEKFCKKHEAELVGAVHALGLNWQGMDLVMDDDGQHYSLEVQPDYLCGTPLSSDGLPWYYPGPTNCPGLFQWLVDNRTFVEKKLPYFYHNWLDKANMFDLCHKEMKRYLSD